MINNIFICHRPYHILRSCDIIEKKFKNNANNTLISFDVILEKRYSCQRFSTNVLFYSVFDNVIELERQRLPSTHQVLKYIRYFNNKRQQFKPIVEKNKDFDNLYFFCDDEVDIELLVELFIEHSKTNAQRVLIDEGLVTYADTTKRLTILGKMYALLLSRLMGLKYFNWKRSYGGSRLYTTSMANNPERASFRQPVNKMQPLSEALCERLRKQICESTNIDVKNKYFIYITTSLVPFEKEKEIIQEIKVFLDNINIPFYIKHHPQQNTEPFEEYLNKECFLEKGYPVELFYSKNAIIGGVGSSSIVNAWLQGYDVIDMASILGTNKFRFSEIGTWINIPSADSIQSFKVLINKYLNNY